MVIETVGNYRARWGEGPLWWNGALLYVDIEGHRVIRFDPASGEEKIWEVGERVGTVVPREAGGAQRAEKYVDHLSPKSLRRRRRKPGSPQAA